MSRALDGTLTLIDDPSNTRETKGRTYHIAIDVGGGLFIRQRVGYHYQPSGPDDPLPYDITTWVEYDPDTSRYRIVETTLRKIEGGPDVSTESLRVVPLATLVTHLGTGVVLEWPEPLTGLPDGRLPRGALDDAALLEVGIVHRLYETIGHKSTAMVAEHYGVSRSTAQKWVRDVRAKGLIEPDYTPTEVQQHQEE